MELVSPAWHGFGFALGLIAAIGAQNAYVLRQSMMGQQTWVTAMTAATCDWILIALGVAGAGALLSAVPALGVVLKWAGVSFLLWFAFKTGRNALSAEPKGWETAESELGRAATSASAAVSATLAISLLNPHVYLDTLVLIGAQGARYTGLAKLAFALGAMLASFVWFSGLALGGVRLRPVTQSKLGVRLLDGAVTLLMLGFAVWLALTDLSTKA